MFDVSLMASLYDICTSDSSEQLSLDPLDLLVYEIASFPAL